MNKRLKKIIKKNKYRSPFYHQYKKPAEEEATERKSNKFLYSIFNRVLLSLIVLLVLLISRNQKKLSFIYDYTFKNMNFMRLRVFVDDKLNGLFPKTEDDYKYVDAVVINLDNSENYRDGLIIETNYAEPVLSLVDGIVISLYKDKNLGNVVVIQDELGREYHYGYLENIEVSIYKSINYGEVLGVGRLNSDFNGEYYLAVKDGADYLDVYEVVMENEN